MLDRLIRTLAAYPWSNTPTHGPYPVGVEQYPYPCEHTRLELDLLAPPTALPLQGLDTTPTTTSQAADSVVFTVYG